MKPETNDGKSQTGTRGKYGAQNDQAKRSTKAVFQVTATPADNGQKQRCSYCRGQHQLKKCEGLKTLPIKSRPK